jgi:hypothetical protein
VSEKRPPGFEAAGANFTVVASPDDEVCIGGRHVLDKTNPPSRTSNTDRRPMAHILSPIPPLTLTGSYGGKSYLNAAGHAECVEFIHQTLKAPPTKLWREGKKVTQDDPSIAPGTAIATFVDGSYPQEGSTGKHAAIYVGQDASGVQVLDQWTSQGEVRQRTIYWKPHQPHPGLSNDGNAFSEIEW